MTDPKPFVFDDTDEAKRFAPATQRNRDVIVDMLRPLLPERGVVLEVASGTGEHAIHFARSFPKLDWQPSDPDPAGIASIAAWSADAALSNLRSPLMLDASAPDWPIAHADAILCINMVHISPWTATEGLFKGAWRVLPTDAMLYLYGPYKRAGVPTAESNLHFDESLRSRNPDWGLRWMEDVTILASACGFVLNRMVEMPANNLSLVFQRT